MIKKLTHNFRMALLKTFLLSMFLSIFVTVAKADHLVGGEITWICQGGGDYIFQLRLIMDCNGVITNSPSEEIQVWNYAPITSITVNYVTDYDASPFCSSSLGNNPISCAAGGTGAYSVFKYISDPINIGGIPPADGWIFTWSDFSRSGAIENLDSPQTFGLTLISKMFNNAGANTSPCYDSSPQFSNDLDALYCVGDNQYVQKVVDPDADSLIFSFTDPLTFITAVQPNFVQPVAIPYSAGYASNSQLPSSFHNAGNVPVVLGTNSGLLTFSSLTQGTFITSMIVESFRCGLKIAEVRYETPITIVPCGGSNSEPSIGPPIISSSGVSIFADTVFAGDLVTFTISTTDIEFLQDGATAQGNTLTGFGAQFGNDFTDALIGCPDPPCATMSSSLPLTGIQGVNAVFNWQTDCNHLKTSNCSNSTTHTFYFKIQDDYCPVPKSVTATAQITILDLPKLPSPELRCVNVALDGSVDLFWKPIVDTTDSFKEYRIYSSSGGPFVLEHVESNIAVGTYSDLTADAQNGSVKYLVRTVSGCSQGEALPADTLSTMYLNVSNPGNGTALLTWNSLSSPILSSAYGYYYILREFPMGTWSILDSVEVNNPTIYIDTISTCSDSLTYAIEVQDSLYCLSSSSLDGGIFQDQIPPSSPVIQSVSVDTSTNQAIITWLPNTHLDTYGHIIFQHDPFGNWYILDTVWGYANTVYYNILSTAGNSSETYGIAAFDSCFNGIPPTSNTSPIGVEHNSILVEGVLDICDRSIQLNWNSYNNWPNQVLSYEIYVSENTGPVSLLVSLPASNFSFQHTSLNANSQYCYVIKATSTDGKFSLSNNLCMDILQPSIPDYLYTQAASIERPGEVQLRIHLDPTSNINGLEIQRSDDGLGSWLFSGSIAPNTNPIIFNDMTASPNNQSYFYKVTAIDSCNREILTSQISRTIFLTVTPDQARLVNLLQWNDYEGFDGAVLGYNIFRIVNDVVEPFPIATIGSGPRYYEDNVESFISSQANGNFCYYVEAIENINLYGIEERCKSNVACGVEEPVIYVPNAFVIGGSNSTFSPVVSFLDINDYEFEVYNRWGKLVFRTENTSESWDGRHKGGLCREDVYVYILTFKSGDGATRVQKGHVTLLHGIE